MTNKVKVIKDQGKFAEIAKRFEGARSDWQKFQQDFVLLYLPSAIHHYLNHGSLPAINRVRTTAVVTRAVSTFGKLVDPFACSPFDTDATRFVSVNAFAQSQSMSGADKAKLEKKFKAKRKRLLSVNKDTGNAKWYDDYCKRLAALEAANNKAKHKTFDQNLLTLIGRVVALANSEDGQASPELQRLADVATEIQPAIETKAKQAA